MHKHKMKRFFYILTAAMLTLGTAAASAQEGSAPKVEPTDSLTILDNKITKLENVASKLPQVSGFIQTMFSWQEGDNDGANYFRIRRARIIFKGAICGDLMDYNFTTDLPAE